ncbi:MAG: Toxin-antitoxin system toxin component, PIN family [Candidatus Levybacteria bacterium GW2011_GWB1_35_5]|nr:MAG: Toxin-antitoxin system toxin component, PIN family [Candidatus Levybacteria bacterium GW2011_GWB1_35_5]
MQNPLRIVNDTNVWLSALYFSGKPAQIVHLIEEKNLISVTSQPILNELNEKMIVDFQTPAFAANGTISYIESLSEFVSIQGRDFGIRDQADNMVLETAILGKCNFLITGDKDLLTLKKYNNLGIITPSQFLNQYNKRTQ